MPSARLKAQPLGHAIRNLHSLEGATLVLIGAIYGPSEHHAVLDCSQSPSREKSPRTALDAAGTELTQVYGLELLQLGKVGGD